MIDSRPVAHTAAVGTPSMKPNPPVEIFVPLRGLFFRNLSRLASPQVSPFPPIKTNPWGRWAVISAWWYPPPKLYPPEFSYESQPRCSRGSWRTSEHVVSSDGGSERGCWVRQTQGS